jgi:hypothetical protein
VDIAIDYLRFGKPQKSLPAAAHPVPKAGLARSLP